MYKRSIRGRKVGRGAGEDLDIISERGGRAQARSRTAKIGADRFFDTCNNARKRR